ncbi:hypothetical protein SAMN04487968_104258 [Nocardioides terrae]|uniref:DUF5667 domain-containing protein n=1 Tax=Nocardioides terrae TaxID=574651 RepID=A0A1I1HAL1_9ACTN|nr:DUF5667 domain-containing protein [Nocardioides terrae]SFC21179.1 hypothetical protein SAMN04487968_104258 [Nocardioides terrae]
MSPAFSTRRRAEQFDALLDGRLTEAPSAQLASLLALADGLRAVPQLAPRAEFTASLRERLMAEAPTALAVTAPDGASDANSRLSVGHHAPGKPRRERRLAVALAAVSIVGATGTSAVASQGALPGDTLYPVKRLVEDVRTTLAMGETAKADVLLSQARTRLEELRGLGERDDVDEAAVKRTIEDFAQDADGASTILLADYADHRDEQAIGKLRTFTAQGATALSELADLLPEGVHGALAEATDAILGIDHSAAEACPACGGGITELPSTLVDLLAATQASLDQAASAPQKPGNGAKPADAVPAVPAPSAGTLPGHVTDPLKTRPGTKSGPGAGVLPTAPPTSLGDGVGQVGDGVGGAVGGVGGAVGDLGDQVGGPLGDTLGDVGDGVSGLGGTVGGTVGGVGGLLDDVTGGLLGTGTSPTPRP